MEEEKGHQKYEPWFRMAYVRTYGFIENLVHSQGIRSMNLGRLRLLDANIVCLYFRVLNRT